MRILDQILTDDNLEKALKRVQRNKGASGVDRMDVAELDEYFNEHKEEIKISIREMRYEPRPVRRVYIPKKDGRKRGLGIPTVVDRVIQQAIAQVFETIYDPTFSGHSYGFRPNRSAHDAMEEVLDHLNEGYEWVIDLDIEKYFDTVNHDKLISCIREKVNEREVLHLIRRFLKAGVMENGMVEKSEIGTPQGGPLSPILSNIYLNKMDQELESRGLRFVRYADDCDIFVKSEMAANRVMKSMTSWLERKLILKVSATKTKVVRPTKSDFLGFTFWKRKDEWKSRPSEERKRNLYQKIREATVRKRAAAKTIGETIERVNQIVRGWINYFRIGSIKIFVKEFGEWMRHKIRVIYFKQWKRPETIYKNLAKLNTENRSRMSKEELFKTANTRLGLYRQAGMQVANYVLSPKWLSEEKEDRPGLVDPLEYYLAKIHG